MGNLAALLITIQADEKGDASNLKVIVNFGSFGQGCPQHVQIEPEVNAMCDQYGFWPLCWQLVSIVLTMVQLESTPVQNDSDNIPAPRIPTMAEIIRLVRDNESLYENLDLRIVDTVTQKGETLLLPPDMIPRHKVIQSHIVNQGQFYRYQAETSGTQMSGKSAAWNSLNTYDGSFTRIIKGNIYNKHHGRGGSEMGKILPHNMLAAKGRYSPFSLWLSGGEVMRSHPGNQVGWSNVDLFPECVGVEDINGYTCYNIKVVSKSLDDDASLLGTMYYWLPIERNYIPIKYQSYKNFRSDHCSQEGEVVDFIRVSEGVWFPKLARRTYYNIFTHYSMPPSVDRTEEFQVTHVDLEPKYPLSFFQDVNPESGIAYYEIQDGTIVQKHIVNADEGKQLWSYVYAALLALAVASLFAVMYAMRKRRKLN